MPDPEPGPGEILIKVHACGVCHTELDEIEGRTPPPFFPVVPGHQVVGRVTGLGKNAHQFSLDDRVGVAWIFPPAENAIFAETALKTCAWNLKQPAGTPTAGMPNI
ncbi:MAG: alcohol dehydrogenase catalytic domain-containing protein [Desulfobacterales bacterium]